MFLRAPATVLAVNSVLSCVDLETKLTLSCFVAGGTYSPARCCGCAAAGSFRLALAAVGYGPRNVGSTGHPAGTALGSNSSMFGWLNGVSSASAVSIGEGALSAVSLADFDGVDLEILSSESVSGSVSAVDVEGSASG